MRYVTDAGNFSSDAKSVTSKYIEISVLGLRWSTYKQEQDEERQIVIIYGGKPVSVEKDRERWHEA